MGLVINFTAEEELIFIDSPIVKSINYPSISEKFLIEILLKLNDLPYVILALDNDGQHPSLHSYPYFTSFCEINDSLYATTEDGIYLISNLYANDDGKAINTGVVFKTDFFIANQKRIRVLILAGDITDVTIQAAVDNIDSKSFSMTNNHCYIDYNYIGHDWDLRITNFDSLDFFDIIPTILGRR